MLATLLFTDIVDSTRLAAELGDRRWRDLLREVERVGDDVSGIAVNIGARVCAMAAGDEVLVSQTVKDLVDGSGLAFVDRGTHALRGVPGEWLFVVDA